MTGAYTENVSETSVAEVMPRRIGRYEVECRLGHGGMGTVYLAADTQLDRLVALKVPRRDRMADPKAVERFFREAKAAARVQHPDICKVHDVGTADGILYLAMEYVEGTPLSAFTKTGQLLGNRQIARLIRGVALAMHQAHLQGVIHRDLKPSNLMLTADWRAVVMDFGVAMHHSWEDSRLTQSGMIVGTPAYMAPEQIDSDLGPLTCRTDIYALGVILYELLAGRLPFTGDVGVVLAKILTAEVVPPHECRSNVDARLEAICRKAMARPPAYRFESMEQFAAALATYLKQRQTEGDRPDRPEAPLPALPPQTEPRPTRSTTEARSPTRSSQRTPKATRRAPRRSRSDLPLGTIVQIVGATAALIFVLIVAIGIYQKMGGAAAISEPAGHDPRIAKNDPDRPGLVAGTLPAEQGIELAASTFTFPENSKSPLRVVFEPVQSVGGRWEILRAAVHINGKQIMDDDLAPAEKTREKPAADKEQAVTPVYSFASEVLPRELLRAGTTLEVAVQITIEIASATGPSDVEMETRDLVRRFKILVVPPP